MNANEFLLLARVEWEAATDPLNTTKRDELRRELESLSAHAAAAAAYVEMRYGSGCGDQGHGDAVKHSNHVMAQVRKSLGYYTTHAISF